MSREAREKLARHRRRQRQLALQRDAGLCQYHLRELGERIPGTEVHHVHGRGRKIGSYREKYTNLLCLCPVCHRKYHDGTMLLLIILRLLREANDLPTNPDF